MIYQKTNEIQIEIIKYFCPEPRIIALEAIKLFYTSPLATELKNDKIRVENAQFAGKRKSQDAFIIV